MHTLIHKYRQLWRKHYIKCKDYVSELVHKCIKSGILFYTTKTQIHVKCSTRRII